MAACRSSSVASGSTSVDSLTGGAGAWPMMVDNRVPATSPAMAIRLMAPPPAECPAAASWAVSMLRCMGSSGSALMALRDSTVLVRSSTSVVAASAPPPVAAAARLRLGWLGAATTYPHEAVWARVLM